MYIHIDPISGIVEPYTDDVQEILNNKPIPSETYLGPTCFNATVHLIQNGNHFQTTPAISMLRRGGKPPGYREVRRVTSRSASNLFKRKTTDGWRFCNDFDNNNPHLIKEQVVLNMPNNRVPTWQWCSVNSLSPHAQNWICYERAVNHDLEEAWASEGNDNFELIISVGITNKRIIIDRSRAFFLQEDVVTGNKRWVRRILLELADVEAQRSTSIGNCPDDICAICICTHAETPMLPRTTLPCKHTFHAACLAPLLDKRCPMCRASFD